MKVGLYVDDFPTYTILKLVGHSVAQNHLVWHKDRISEMKCKNLTHRSQICRKSGLVKYHNFRT